MKSLNIKIDEQLYDSLRSIGYTENKPVAKVVREFLEKQIDQLRKKKKLKKVLVLDEEDEQKVRSVLSSDEWVSEKKFMKEHKLS